jgi:hypothetical protein
MKDKSFKNFFDSCVSMKANFVNFAIFCHTNTVKHGSLIFLAEKHCETPVPPVPSPFEMKTT